MQAMQQIDPVLQAKKAGTEAVVAGGVGSFVLKVPIIASLW